VAVACSRLRSPAIPRSAITPPRIKDGAPCDTP
jgi:hypothetical protein